MRKVLDEIMQAPVIDAAIPEPVFLGLEQRRKEKLGIEVPSTEAMDVLEIDLDEDGPLREEYLPKRRVSHTGSVRGVRSKEVPEPKIYVEQAQDWDGHNSGTVDTEKPLPPPAKWSPAADEPIFRESRRTSGQYVAVQPPLAATHFAVPLPPVYQQQETRYPNWPTAASYVPVTQHFPAGFAYDPISIQQTLPSYTPYPYTIHDQPRSRSQSMSRNHENCLPRNHSRSYSQSVFNRCGDIHMTANEGAPREARWAAPGLYARNAHCRQPFGPHPSVNYQSTWLRT